MEDKKQEAPPGIVLPTEKTKPKAVNPRNLLIYGKEKSGKTTAVSKLPNCLIIDVEDGTGFIEGLIMQPPAGMGPVSRFKWLKDLAKSIKEANQPYDYVVIDTISQLDIEAEWVGTWDYMNSIAGKNFNRATTPNGDVIIDPNTKKSIMLPPTDPEYQSVLTLGQGYGYRYTRNAIMDIFDSLKNLGKICTIFVCHVADKMIALKGKDEVMIKDLALVGKTRDILPRLVDGTGNVWNEDGQFMISFKGNDQQLGGIRATHLVGYAGPLDWDKIFIKEESTTVTKPKQ